MLPTANPRFSTAISSALPKFCQHTRTRIDSFRNNIGGGNGVTQSMVIATRRVESSPVPVRGTHFSRSMQRIIMQNK